MEKRANKFGFLLLLLSLSLSPRAEAGFFSSIKKIIKKLTSDPKDTTKNSPIADTIDEPRDIGKPPRDTCSPTSTNSDLSYLDKVKKIASGSACASYKWKQRRIASTGYMEGMALMYARAVCFPNSIVSRSKLGTKGKDALAYYGKEGSSKNTYAILIGMGMRESSGQYCIGKDKTPNEDSETSEAGLFQSSYNARNPWKEPEASKELLALYKEYKDGKKKCFLDTFSKDVECDVKDWKNWGSGEGVNFQKISKECPAFATEFAAISIRVNKNHYGTLEVGETEFKEECVSMLTEVEKVVNTTPQVCSEL